MADNKITLQFTEEEAVEIMMLLGNTDNHRLTDYVMDQIGEQRVTEKVVPYFIKSQGLGR